MANPESLELGSSVSLTRVSAEDVPLVPHVEDADLGWGRATAQIGANSLRMTTIAEGNTQADMLDWMAGSIDALQANIGWEHGIGLREDKTLPGFHDSPEYSPQACLESVAQGSVRLNIDSMVDKYRFYYYLNEYEAAKHVSENLDTNKQSNFRSENKKFFVKEYHYTLYTNFVLSGSSDIHVTGHSGEYTLSADDKVYASHFDRWNTDSLVFSYAGNSGNNTFAMTWGFFEIDLSVGGSNSINVRDSIAREIIGGGGNDTIDIRGHGAHADLIDLRNGGNNSVYSEAWAHIIGGAGNDTIVSRPTFNNGNGIHADLSAGGDNHVTLRGAASSVTLGAGNDTITVANQWNNGGHPGNWSSATIDLSLGGNNRVDITGNTHTSGPTRAHITLGSGNDFIEAGDHTVVTILGESSTGNDYISLQGSAGAQGEVHTGQGHTTIGWYGGNYAFEFGSGDLTFTTGENLYHQFVFDGSERTGNDKLILNNLREGGVIHTGQGHTDVTLNGGSYDFHLGSGSVNMSVHGHVGIARIYDAVGNLIVGRVDGQSPVAQAVHTFTAGEGINYLHYSLELGGGVDKVQFYASSGHYQVTSSANADIFQLDFLTGGTVGATYEVFDFKWGSDRIMDETGDSMDEMVFSDFSEVRFQYQGQALGGHAFDLIAVADVGNYQVGHVWMTVYSHDLPDLNFV